MRSSQTSSEHSSPAFRCNCRLNPRLLSAVAVGFFFPAADPTAPPTPNPPHHPGIALVVCSVSQRLKSEHGERGRKASCLSERATLLASCCHNELRRSYGWYRGGGAFGNCKPVNHLRHCGTAPSWPNQPTTSLHHIRPVAACWLCASGGAAAWLSKCVNCVDGRWLFSVGAKADAARRARHQPLRTLVSCNQATCEGEESHRSI